MMKFALVSAVLLSLACSTSAKKTAKAVHILMKEEDEIKKVQEEIEGGGDFAKLAEKHSTCPSGKKGGDLGSFSPGSMVKEFDTVVFDPKTELGKVYGPVKTQFGFHLIKVVERDGKTAGSSDEKKKKKKKKIPAMESVKTAAQFKDILAHKDAYALEFYSSMCGSCKEFSPVWDKYAKAGPPVRTAKVNIDDAGGMELAQTLGVMEEGVCVFIVVDCWPSLHGLVFTFWCHPSSPPLLHTDPQCSRFHRRGRAGCQHHEGRPAEYGRPEEGDRRRREGPRQEVEEDRSGQEGEGGVGLCPPLGESGDDQVGCAGGDVWTRAAVLEIRLF